MEAKEAVSEAIFSEEVFSSQLRRLIAKQVSEGIELVRKQEKKLEELLNC